MRQLAIECATEACSVAVFDNAQLLDHRHLELGRGHAERLIPLISELPEKGKAQRILVSLGPGSFTGVRIGLAAARALGFAWGAPVAGFPTLALVAATARHNRPDTALTICMNGGHGEWFVQDFDEAGLPQAEQISLPLADALSRPSHSLIAGNRAAEMCEANPHLCAVPCLPDARFVPALPEALFTQQLAPIYGRAPDAQLPKAG